MTFLPVEQQGLGLPQNFGQGLLDFLQKPETMALAQGLLSQASPSMTEPRSFAGALQAGLAEMAKRKDLEEQKKFEQAKMAILQGHLDIDTAKFKLEQQQVLEAMKRQRALQDLYTQAPETEQEILQNIDNTLPQTTESKETLPSTGLEDNVMPKPIQSLPGLLGSGSGNFPMSEAQQPMVAPPSAPTMPKAEKPKNNMITLKNGWQVTPQQYRQIQAALLAGKPEKIVDIIGAETEKEPELIKIAKAAGLEPGSPEWNEFLKNVKLKPQTQVNIGDEATRTFVTKQQNVIAGVDSVLPSIDELIDLAQQSKIPSQGAGISIFSPNQQAKYEAIASQAIEPLLGSFGLNSNEHNAKMVAKQIERQSFETKEAYIKRLQELRADLINRRKYATGVTTFRGIPEPPPIESKKETETAGKTYSQEDLEYTAKKHGLTVSEVKKKLGIE